jgi:hypothetical protein
VLTLKKLWHKVKVMYSIWKGGEKDMATVYVTLIINGYRTYDEVPAVLKPQVKEQLIVLGLEELVTE